MRWVGLDSCLKPDWLIRRLELFCIYFCLFCYIIQTSMVAAGMGYKRTSNSASLYLHSNWSFLFWNLINVVFLNFHVFGPGQSLCFIVVVHLLRFIHRAWNEFSLTSDPEISMHWAGQGQGRDIGSYWRLRDFRDVETQANGMCFNCLKLLWVW